MHKSGIEQLETVIRRLEHKSITANPTTFASLLRQCGASKSLSHAKRIHEQIKNHGFSNNSFLGDLLIQMYAKCSSYTHAKSVFDSLPRKNIFSWNFIIRACPRRTTQGAKEAIQLYSRMRSEGIDPEPTTFASVLTAIATLGDVELGKELHTKIDSLGFKSLPYLQNSLISMYAKCNCIDPAREIFNQMQKRDVFSWTAMITAYAQNGEYREAIGLYHKMSFEGVEPDGITFSTVLGACGCCQDIESGRSIHEKAVKAGLGTDIIVQTSLVGMYAKCREVEVARNIFDTIREKDLICWNAMIAAYVQTGSFLLALDLYEELRRSVRPNAITLSSAMAACSCIGDFERGMEIYSTFIGSDSETDIAVQNALVNLHARCGHIEGARKLFNEMQLKDVISWNTMISGYAQGGYPKEALEVYKKMDMKPEKTTFASVLGACAAAGDLEEGKSIHARLASMGFQSHTMLQNALVDMYGKCGDLQTAERMFESIEDKTCISWTSLISGYVQQGQGREALPLLNKMELAGVEPSDFTLVSGLSACAISGNLKLGEALHSRLLVLGFSCDPIVNAALVNMYAKCGKLETARKIFDRMNDRDVTTWTTLIAAYVYHGQGREALEVYRRMEESRVQPNEVTLTNVILACSKVGDLARGRSVQGQVREFSKRISYDRVLWNALINMYAKCGEPCSAREVFDGMQEVNKDVVTWNSMIHAYASNSLSDEALAVYEEMVTKGMKPDEITLVSVLGACASLGDLNYGKLVHCRALADIQKKREQGLQSVLPPAAQNALVNMYAKCGSFVLARKAFEENQYRDVISWSSIICVCAHSGHVDEALHLLVCMVLDGVQPNGVTFVSILTSCSQAGMFNEGLDCFGVMVSDYDIVPVVEHYVCIADLLGRSGRVTEAEELLDCMPFEPNGVSWMTLLSACSKVDGDVERAKSLADKVARLEPHITAPYVVLSNMISVSQDDDIQEEFE